MTKILIFILFFCVNCTIFSQQLTLKKIDEIPAYYQQFNNLKIKLSSDNIEINNSNQNVFSETIDGKKILKISPHKNYFLITNLNSSQQNGNYNISFFVFDEEGNVLNRQKLNSFSNQSSPLFALNDDGIVSAFNPVNFELNIFYADGKNKIYLENNITVDYKRSSFIEMNENDIYILSALSTINTSSNQTNVNLYKINLNSKSFIKKGVDYSTPVLLKLNDNEIIISGIKYTNSVAQPNISVINNKMEIIKETKLAAEKLVKFNTDFYIKYGSAMYVLDNNLNKVSEYFFANSEKVEDFNLVDNKILVLTRKDNFYNVYNLSRSFKLKAEAAVRIPGHSFVSSDWQGDILFIHTDNETFLYE